MADLDGTGGYDCSLEEGAEPQEEVGPDGCLVTKEQCELQPNERDAPQDDCKFSPEDELHEAFELAPIPLAISPDDGLLAPVTDAPAFAPAFCEENIVCLADERRYVELFGDELLDRGWLPQYEAAVPQCALPDERVWIDMEPCKQPTGFVLRVRKMYADDGSRRERTVYEPSRVMDLWGQKFALVDGSDHVIVAVRPVREKCAYYKRQVFGNHAQQNPKDPGHYMHYPHCTMRRSVGGAFMSLENEAIYACDYRSPQDNEAVGKYLDAFDKARLVNRPDKTFVPMLGLGGEEVRSVEKKEPRQ